MALPETITDARVGADHRADHVALHKRFNLEFDVNANFGAIGNGTTDDTTAINAAITAAAAAGGGKVWCPSPSYKVTSLNMLSEVSLVGTGMRSTILVGTAGSDIIVLPTAGGNSVMQIRGLGLSGGRRGIAYSAGATASYASYVTVADVEISGPTSECVYTEGSIEEWYFDNVRLLSGTYGFRHANVVQEVGSSYVDKCTFKDVLTAGQTEQGWRLEALTGGTNTWINPIINTAAKDGFYADGGFTACVFINPNTEGNGSTGKSNRTTGSITTGTASLVVASATGYATSDSITVAGAGSAGADLTTTVSAVAGTTLTLAANAATTVTDADVTNAAYDDFKFNNTIASPTRLQFHSGVIGSEGAGGHIRYALNLGGTYGTQILGVSATADVPVYDPTQSAVLVGGQIDYRASTVIASDVFRSTVLPGNTAKSISQVTSANGKDFRVILRDSTGNTSGTYGSFRIYKYNPNRNDLVRVSGTTGEVLTFAGIGPGSPGGGMVGKRLYYDSAAPGSGTFVAGDIVFNTAPTAGGTVGWVCTTGGTPGVWKTFGAIAA